MFLSAGVSICSGLSYFYYTSYAKRYVSLAFMITVHTFCTSLSMCIHCTVVLWYLVFVSQHNICPTAGNWLSSLLLCVFTCPPARTRLPSVLLCVFTCPTLRTWLSSVLLGVLPSVLCPTAGTWLSSVLALYVVICPTAKTWLSSVLLSVAICPTPATWLSSVLPLCCLRSYCRILAVICRCHLSYYRNDCHLSWSVLPSVLLQESDCNLSCLCALPSVLR
jgi:hypothetical protein